MIRYFGNQCVFGRNRDTYIRDAIIGYLYSGGNRALPSSTDTLTGERKV